VQLLLIEPARPLKVTRANTAHMRTGHSPTPLGARRRLASPAAVQISNAGLPYRFGPRVSVTYARKASSMTPAVAQVRAAPGAAMTVMTARTAKTASRGRSGSNRPLRNHSSTP